MGLTGRRMAPSPSKSELEVLVIIHLKTMTASLASSARLVKIDLVRIFDLDEREMGP